MRKHMDRRVRPYVDTGQAISVNVTMWVHSFRAVDEEHQEFTMDIYLRKWWQDPRLVYENGPHSVVMKAATAEQFIWMPDLFFSNSRLTRLYETLSPDSGLKVFEDGRVLLSSRFSITFHCDMNLAGFPFDEHYCDLNLESYMHTQEDLQLNWAKEPNAVEVSKNAYPPAFSFLGVTTAGNYEKIYARFHVRRLCMHYVMTIYIPCILLVSLLYLLFWTPISNLTARAIYASFLFLALIVLLGISQYAAPQVGYVKALDVWAVCSMLFSFLAVLHLIIQSLFHIGATKAMRNDQFELMEDELCSKSEDGKSGDAPAVFVHPILVRRLDLAMRIIFPAAYALFNAIYWGSYAK